LYAPTDNPLLRTYRDCSSSDGLYPNINSYCFSGYNYPCSDSNANHQYLINQAPYTSSPVSQVPAPTPVITATLGQETLLSPTLSITPNENYTVLTVTQKERIYYASLSYLAPTESQAVQIARSLKFVKNDGHPSNMCGPLAVAILRDAGLISRYTDLHDFWLLNPRTNTQIIQRTFPEDEFTKYHYSQPINEIDCNYLPTVHQLSIFVAVENFLRCGRKFSTVPLRAAAGGSNPHIGQKIASLRSQ
jgi:hypothetical protein